MSTTELDSKLTSIIKEGITKVVVPKINPSTVKNITFRRNFSSPGQKIIETKEEIDEVINFLNEIKYNYSDETNFSEPSYSIQVTGDIEYSIGFYGTRIKYNDKWYSVDVKDSGGSRKLAELYEKLRAREIP